MLNEEDRIAGVRDWRAGNRLTGEDLLEIAGEHLEREPPEYATSDDDPMGLGFGADLKLDFTHEMQLLHDAVRGLAPEVRREVVMAFAVGHGDVCTRRFIERRSEGDR